MILKSCCYIISFLFILVGIQKFFGTSVKRERENTNFQNKKEVSFFLLIPVFKETKIIQTTINYFNNIQNKKIHIYYITTEKEKDENGNNETYNILINNVKKKNIINYPKVDGDKASQINYAIQKLSSYHHKNCYFGIFDADSRPNFGVFKYINQDINHGECYQMLSIYNTNYSVLSMLNKANAILQTRWSFYFELQKLYGNYKTKTIKNLMYVIGHGLFIRGDVLGKFQFPEDTITEDISLGYKMCLSGIFTKPVVGFYDYCSVPKHVFQNITQIGRRFYGEFNLIINYIIHNTSPKRLFYKRLYELIIRGFGGSFICTIVIIAIIYNWFMILGLVTIGLILDYISFYRIKCLIERQYTHSLSLYMCTILKNIVDLIPLSISLYQIILNKKQKFIKTAR